MHCDAGSAFGNLCGKIKSSRCCAHPSLAIAEFRSKGTALPTGKPYEQTCISVVRTDGDGLITHYLDYWNPLVAIEALTPDSAPSDSELGVTFGG